MKNNRTGIRDLITVGIFGAIIFAITMLTSMILGVTPVSYLFMACGLGLLSGPVYFLAISRSNKRFVSFLIWTLNGLLWGLMGGYSVLIGMALFSLLGEIVLWNKENRSFLRMSISYCLGVMGYHAGSFFMLYFFTDKFIAMLNNSAEPPSSEHVQAMISAGKGPIGIAAIAAVLACSVISCLFAKKILKKHFMKAGIV